MQRQFFSALVAAVMLVIGFSTAAQAQQTILVINEQRILLESAVGLHISSEIERIGTEMQTELTPLATRVQQENDALTAETAALSEEAIRQRPDLLARLEGLQASAAEFERRRQIAGAELQATERAAMQPVLAALQTVLQEIVEERNADLLIDRSQVVFASDSMDVSEAAIARLNALIPTTPVNRVRLPQQQAGAPAQ